MRKLMLAVVVAGTVAAGSLLSADVASVQAQSPYSCPTKNPGGSCNSASGGTSGQGGGGGGSFGETRSGNGHVASGQGDRVSRSSSGGGARVCNPGGCRDVGKY